MIWVPTGSPCEEQRSSLIWRNPARDGLDRRNMRASLPHPKSLWLGSLGSGCLAVVLWVTPSLCQPEPLVDQPGDVLEAVYLERFTRFVDWPPEVKIEERRRPFQLCLIGAQRFAPVLKQIYADQPIRGKVVQIRVLPTVADVLGCHLLFVGALSEDAAASLFRVIRSRPILSVGDRAELAQSGVHINMELVDGRIRFDINETAARAAGLRVSHLLLRLARTVR